MRLALTLSKYCFKNLKRIKWLYILLGIYTVLLIISTLNKSPRFLHFTYNQEYKLVAYIIVLYLAINIEAINKEVFKPIIKKFWVEQLSNILVILRVICIINILFIGVSLYIFFSDNISIGYYLNGLIGNIVIFNLGLILFMAIGLILGKYSKKSIAYIASIVVVYFFNSNYFTDNYSSLPEFNEYTFKELVNNFYSVPIYKMNINGKLSALINYDEFFFYHCIFLIITVVVIIACYFILGSEFNKPAIIISICIVGAILISNNIGTQYNSYAKKYTSISSENFIEEGNLIINKYEMDLALGDRITNTCTITGQIMHSSNDIVLGLDKELEVESVSSNNKNIEFVREENRIRIDTNKLNGEISLTIKYTGTINYRDNYDMVQYFSRDEDSFLTENIAWYPMVKGENKKEYELKIKSQNEVYMNLDKLKDDKSYNIFKGESNGLLIISGFLKTYGDKDMIAYEGWSNKDANEVNKKYSIEARKNNIDILIEMCKENISEIDKILANPSDEAYIMNTSVDGNYENELKKAKVEEEEKLKVHLIDKKQLESYEGLGINIMTPIYIYKTGDRNIKESYFYGDYHLLDGILMINE